MPNVVIVMARCAKSKQDFGIRLEERHSDHWEASWAFPMKEKIARKEGYDKSNIKGTFVFTEEYPGCPICKESAAFKCSCSKVACWDGITRQVTCPWCGQASEIAGEVDHLEAGRDR